MTNAMVNDDIITRAINESINKLLIREYHHSNDEDNLQQMCVNTARYLIDNCGEVMFKGYVEGVDGKMVGVTVIKDHSKEASFAAYDPTTGVVHVGDKTIMKCAESNDVRRLASLIYHEFGHQTNHIKSNSAREIQKDVYTPMFIEFGQDVYEAYSKVLYRFNDREMKARCFEATMFLKQSETLPSLEEYYSDRCTDVRMMRQFIGMLKNMATKRNADNEYVIGELFNNTLMKGSFKKRQKVPYEVMARKVIEYFTRKFDWFKRRVDKIYYDFKENFEAQGLEK